MIQSYTPTRPICSAAAGRLAPPPIWEMGSRSSLSQSFSTLAPQLKDHPKLGGHYKKL
uniref:Uncharacterized protein n=1 Tax=Anguilla anguilla TaxID=7936 RepID=A0A0E9U516_ANGAN